MMPDRWIAVGIACVAVAGYVLAGWGAPTVYDYAYTMVEGKTPEQMPDVLHETFGRTVEESRTTPPEATSGGPASSTRTRADGSSLSRARARCPRR